MNIFLSVLKIKSVLYVWVLTVFTISACLFEDKIKFLLASIKSLLVLEILSVTLFRKLVLVLRHPKLFRLFHYWERRKAGTEILMRLSEQSIELANVFKEVVRNFLDYFFSFTRQPLYSTSFKTICACTENWFNLIGQKIDPLTLSL